MTDPAIIAASYAAERNYSHNPDDVIDPSGAVLAIGTEKVDTTTLKDRSPENNDATVKGPMPTEGFIQGRRFTAANSDYIDCGNDSSLEFGTGAFSIEMLLKTRTLVTGTFYTPLSRYVGAGQSYYEFLFTSGSGNLFKFHIRDNSNVESFVNEVTDLSDDNWHHVVGVRDNVDSKLKLYIDGKLDNSVDDNTGSVDFTTQDLTIGGIKTAQNFNGSITHVSICGHKPPEEEIKQNFNTLARLPFWSVNYTDYPNNVTEYTDNLPYSSSIISLGTFKVDDDKLQCVSAGTMTYSASYEFDGSEYIKVEIGGMEYAGTGTITQGNTTVSVAQGSNKVTIVMGTGDTIEGEIGIQFREEV